MAKKKLRHSGQFKKGNKAAVGKGRPKVTDEVRAARKLSRDKFVEIANRYFDCTVAELEKIWNDPQTTAMDKMVVAVIRRAIVEGDQTRLTMLLNRTVGKELEPDKTLNVNFSSLPQQQIIQLGKEAIEYLESADDE